MKFCNSVIVALTTTTALLGCTFHAVDKADKHYEQTEEKVRDGLKQNVYAARRSNVRVTDQPLVTGKTFREKEDERLPEYFTRPLKLKLSGAKDLDDLLVILSEESGVAIELSSDVTEDQATTAATVPQQQASDSTTIVGSNGESVIIPNAPSFSSTKQAAMPSVQLVDGSLTLTKYLDQIARRTELNWRWDSTVKKVYVYRYLQRVFSIDRLPSVFNATTQISSNSQSAGSTSAVAGGGSSSSSQGALQTNYRVDDVDTWKDLETNIKTMLSGKGKATLSRSTNSITIIDRPFNVAQIDEYIKKTNATLRRRVFLDIKFYNVTNRDSDNYGFDLDAIYTQITNSVTDYSVGLGSSGQFTDLPFLTIRNSNPNSRTNGSRVMVEAISKVANVSLLNELPIHAQNGMPVNVRAARDRSYIERIGTSVINQTSAGTQVTPGKTSSGVSGNVTARVTSDGRIEMQGTFVLASTEAIDTINIGDNGDIIQLPVENKKDFVLNHILQTGETLALLGLSTTQGDNSRSGIGSARMWPVGGRINGNYAVDKTLVIITPYILE